jgi:hypothetical protein
VDEIEGVAVNEASTTVLEDSRRCGGLCRAIEPLREKKDDCLPSRWVPPVSQITNRYLGWAPCGCLAGPVWWASVHSAGFLFSVLISFLFSALLFEFT